MKPDDLLKDYKSKRDFARTAEPAGQVGPSGTTGGRFVVQKHDATRLHYDFRLELDGVLKSWAVTKGPSTNPADKRLAVRVEDHPLDYGSFEGTIPKGEYGGGTVLLWDEGTWEPLGDPHAGLESGDLKFRLKGKRMKGEWVLVHMKGRDQKTRHGARENWLLIKHRDRYASEGDGLTEKFTTSVTTGRDLEGIAKGLKPRKTTARAARAAPKSQVWSGGKAVALPEFRPPQLATLVDEVPAGRQWLFEMKYDGYRCLAAVAGPEVRLYTRNGNDWTTQFHRIVAPLAKLTGGSALIDGEICAFKDGRTDFSTLKDALSSSGPLVYFAFDLLELDGETLEKLPLTERKDKLRSLLGNIDKDAEVQFSEHVLGNGEKVFAAMCEADHEGVIAKRADARYAHARNRDWLKIKCLKRQEFVIAGWRPSERKKTFASLILGTWEGGKLIYRGRVGTGFTQQSAAELQTALDARAADEPAFAAVPRPIRRHARWVRPELVAEIAYTEITPDGVLRHPSFIGLRQDKPAGEVHIEAPAGKAASKPAKAATKPTGKPVQLTDDMGIAAAEKLGVRLTHPERVVFPSQGVTKAGIAAYYEAVAERMLPHIVQRPLSLVRCPQGRARHCFFQKHASGGFPSQFKDVPITEKDGAVEDYLYVDGLDGILAGVQMNSLEFHIWGSHIQSLEKPDRIVFDIDPDEGLGFAEVRAAAMDIRSRLFDLGLQTFAMPTGGKGIHVIAPLTPRVAWPEVKSFCRAFAEQLAVDEPDRFTANIRKASRKGRMFVDYLRNERGATAIAPFSTRSREGAPCAVPIAWDEVDTLQGANLFSLEAAAERARGPDPWPDYFKLRQSITKPMQAALSRK
jgi:bifunctional non-homologous end joining protein LigD